MSQYYILIARCALDHLRTRACRRRGRVYWADALLAKFETGAQLWLQRRRWRFRRAAASIGRRQRARKRQGKLENGRRHRQYGMQSLRQAHALRICWRSKAATEMGRAMQMDHEGTENGRRRKRVDSSQDQLMCRMKRKQRTAHIIL